MISFSLQFQEDNMNVNEVSAKETPSTPKTVCSIRENIWFTLTIKEK